MLASSPKSFAANMTQMQIPDSDDRINSIPIEPPPEPSPSKQTLRGDLQQAWGYVLFVLNMSKRIRSPRNRFRFIVGLIIWKPFLPEED